MRFVPIALASVMLLALSPAAHAVDIVTQQLDLGALSVPGSKVYGHSFSAPLPFGMTSSDTFYDDYIFTIPAATFTSFTANIDLLPVLGIAGLKARLYTGTLSTTTTGGMLSGAQLLQRWSSAVGVGTGSINVIAPIVLGPGSYVFEVRGNVVGSAGGAYAGTLNLAPPPPVPEPGTYGLLACGLIGLGLKLRKATGAKALAQAPALA